MSSVRTLIFFFLTTFASAETIQTDLLIVGGTESGWAAAIQAALDFARETPCVLFFPAQRYIIHA